MRIILYIRRRVGYIYVDYSLFVLLYNTNFMNKIKFNDSMKLKIINWLHNFSSIYKITPFSTQRKCWSTKWWEDIALLVYLYIISLCMRYRIINLLDDRRVDASNTVTANPSRLTHDIMTEAAWLACIFCRIVWVNILKLWVNAFCNDIFAPRQQRVDGDSDMEAQLYRS